MQDTGQSGRFYTDCCKRLACSLQVDSMFDEFSGRTVVDLGCGTVSGILKPAC